MTVLVTGSNGYVGSRLMYYLAEKGINVIGIDRSEKCNITPHQGTRMGDLLNPADMNALPQGTVNFNNAL